jgi:hypothetical protein
MNDGGHAFPISLTAGGYCHSGMTLRDYFAVKIIQGVLSGGSGYASSAELATEAYKCADAMLEARRVITVNIPSPVADPDHLAHCLKVRDEMKATGVW